ncbi:hypothetical protein MLD38_029594 [Melastoma candidum]|uniref:Uncharacterized protein n=1 Tax=Melastoma candidum TaxID=119954 RepID=A0ACB9N6L9_9MYRT|nr:hypothetical protein MLD38_029594 [Melastoma candidum]
MSDFFSLQGGGGGAFDEQLGLGDQRSYPDTNPSGVYSAAAVPLQWIFHPGAHQEEQQFFRNQLILQQRQQDLYAASSADFSGLRGGVGVGVGLGIGGDIVDGGVRGGFGGRSCQDCGNHAKKDCAHLRCRTCCMSRGFECPTHVKSTWVPAAKRRERQQQMQQLVDIKWSKHATTGESMEENAVVGEQSQRDEEDLLPDAAMACTRMASSNTSTGLELPAELTTSTVFTCVRVSSADDPNDQIAYQTAVSIGGHVFKGILYDHGSEATYFDTDAVAAVGGVGGDTTSSGGIVQPLNLVTVPSTVAAGETSRNVDPSLYAAAATSSTLDAYAAGTQFFLQER